MTPLLEQWFATGAVTKEEVLKFHPLGRIGKPNDMAFVNGFFTLGCAYSWLAIYPVELFTSSVRSTAASFIFNATRLVAWIFPIAAGTVIQFCGGIRQAVMMLGSIYLLGLIIPFFLPETRSKPLPR